MNQSYWLILVFVATMVCNGNCRPRELESTNIYPVYRSIKQLEHENRYEKPFDQKQDDDSVAYQRIDIPHVHNDHFKATEKWKEKNNCKSVIDYVPVALTIKKTNVKKWPSDQNGIESQDDLSLYNTYTSNINPLSVVQNTGNFPYITQTKPSILILEELPRPPVYEYTDIRPLHIQPGVSQYLLPSSIEHTTMNQYYFSTQNAITERPQHLFFQTSQYPVTTQKIPLQPQFTQTIQPTSFPTTHTSSIPDSYYKPQPATYLPTQTTQPVKPTSTKPETSTKKRKKTKCPNVSITSNNSINNNNSQKKEGCQDINIHINTSLTNTNQNTNVEKPTKPANNTAMVVIQNDPPTQSNNFGLFDVFWSIITRVFSISHPILTAILAPFSSFVAGGVSVLSMIIPFMLPQVLYGGRNQKKFVMVNQQGMKSKYLHQKVNTNVFTFKELFENGNNITKKVKKEIS